MIVFINVFHVAPEHQEKACDILIQITDDTVRHAPGFISATLHRSPDGTKLAMHACWRSHADYEAMRRDPTPSQALQELMAIARFEPGLYEVVQVFEPSQG